MLPDSMIERVARKLCELNMLDPDQHIAVKVANGTARQVPMWDSQVPVARAVLTTMREPTERIVTAIQPFCKSDDFDTDQSAAIDAWQSAIDAVLAEA